VTWAFCDNHTEGLTTFLFIGFFALPATGVGCLFERTVEGLAVGAAIGVFALNGFQTPF
jgi:hypothetical protein